MMIEILILIIAFAGALFILLAAVGLVRMPDLYLRISVTTKAATLGIGMLLACAAFHFNDIAITSRVLAIILFMLLTAPVGAHLLGRASYFIGIPMWKKSIMDDLKGKYELGTHELTSEENGTNEQADEEEGKPEKA